MRAPIIALRDQRQTHGQHPGLLLQRYLCEKATGEDGKPKEKRAVLQAAINAAANEGVRALYHAAFERWSASLPADPKPVDLQTLGRLIVGLGSETVLETGIRLHHTYGLPILPGSALKGLAAHYCDQVWGERNNATPSEAALKFRGPRREDRQRNQPAEAAGQYHQLLFGATDDSGCIVFHDAWFVPDSESQPLRLDVMTPHHAKWLDGSVAPTDFDSPTPVPFLSVRGTFRIAVSWHGPPSDDAADWTKLSLSLLCSALAASGIGAKTSSGYGRLVSVAEVPSGRAGLQSTTAQPLPPQPIPAGPRHTRGEKIVVTCIEAPAGKKKAKFKADDGFIGHIASDQQPAVSAGQTLDLCVANVGPHGYTFSTIEVTVKQKQPQDARKGGRRR